MSEPRVDWPLPISARDEELRALWRLRDRVIEATRDLGQMNGDECQQSLKELGEMARR